MARERYKIQNGILTPAKQCTQAQAAEAACSGALLALRAKGWRAAQGCSVSMMVANETVVIGLLQLWPDPFFTVQEDFIKACAETGSPQLLTRP